MANSQRAIATELLKLEKKIAGDLLKIDGYKDALREIAKETGEAFIEDLTEQGLGTVEVKAGREEKFKGRVPQLQAETFLDLTEGKQKKLVEDGLVAWVNEYTKGAKPSVTVRL